jgi:hypothetical protein
MNYLPGLASNCHPPDLCLQSSWDYRREPPAWAAAFFLYIFQFLFFFKRSELCSEELNALKTRRNCAGPNLFIIQLGF